MQWSRGLVGRLAKWPLSSVAQNSCRCRSISIPGNSHLHTLLGSLVSYHRSWLSSTESLQGFLSIHGSSFIHSRYLFFPQLGALLIRKWNMGSLICVTAIFPMRLANANFFFRREGKKKKSCIHLVGSVNVRAHVWPTPWVYRQSHGELTVGDINRHWHVSWLLFSLHSLGVVIHARLPLSDGGHPGTAGRWGCLPTYLCDSFSPRTASGRPVEGRQCCDSTGWLWFPVTCARGRRWPAGTHSIPQSFD